MADDGGKIFDEREIRAILKRAADLQKTEGGSPQSGLSLEELRLLASEAGIDPNFVERAAYELTSGYPEEEEKSDFFGGPFSFTFEREITGHSSPELWDSIVTTIRKVYKDSGSVRTWGNSMEWTHSGFTSPHASVTLSDINGKLKLQVFYKDATIPIPFFLNYFVAGVISTGMTMSTIANPLLGIAILFSVFIPLFFLVRFGAKSLAQKKKKRAKMLTEELVRLCVHSNASSEKPSTEASVSERRHIGHSLLEAMESDDIEQEDSDSLSGTKRKRVH